MSIDRVSSANAMHAFFKAVDAARQRNDVAFSGDNASGRTNYAESTDTVSKFSPAYFRTYGMGVQNIQEQSQTNTASAPRKILGNFFDAYA
jgi:hypothetical protein